jgi:hypothetical protein
MLAGSPEIPPNLTAWLDHMVAYMLAAPQQPEGLKKRRLKKALAKRRGGIH